MADMHCRFFLDVYVSALSASLDGVGTFLWFLSYVPVLYIALPANFYDDHAMFTPA